MNLKDGIKFIFSHFAPDEPSQFPRTVSTMVTDNGQRLVFDFETIQDYFTTSDEIDCKIAGYPSYDWMAQHNKISWSYIPKYWILFIDKEHGDIQKTLHNIKMLFNGGSPTVLATGNGCHIYLPILITNHEEFFNNDTNLIVEFIRYSEKRVTEGQSDKGHFQSLKNSMLRVPGSYNLKCIMKGKEPSEIRVLQKWDGFRVSPSKDLLKEYQQIQTRNKLWELKQEKIANDRIKQLRKEGSLLASTTKVIDPLTEFLIFESAGIADGRMNMLYYVIARYLIMQKGLDYKTAEAVCWDWLNRCNTVSKLRVKKYTLKYHIKHCIQDAIHKNKEPFSVEYLKHLNNKVYQNLITEYEDKGKIKEINF